MGQTACCEVNSNDPNMQPYSHRLNTPVKPTTLELQSNNNGNKYI